MNNMLIIGIGQVGKALIKASPDPSKITATTRDPLRVFWLADLGVKPIIMPLPSAEIIEPIADGKDVIATFPPDGQADAILAKACRKARRLIYISSTGVYGSQTGTIDNTSSPDRESENTKARLAAEDAWLANGAIVLRPPGIYGPANGLHLRLKEGTFKLPGNGERLSSRIHVDDLARIILAVLAQKNLEHKTYVVGDLNPCSLKELVQWLCEKMHLPFPESTNPENVNITLRNSRSIDSSFLLNELGLKLLYPSYQDGYKQCLESE
ncbi:MAG: NAD-dependent epimerase/dehydratase family protein [Candidatus Obscuribacterales bacterium]|nr:NAD-dependent epimerase/dehydratase family protein [Candidatus Obscuribacterales bacterium]